MKKIVAITLSILMAVSLVACTKSENSSTETTTTTTSSTEETVIDVYTLMGPTGIGMSKLINDNTEGTSELKYNFTIASAPDQITSQVIQGDYDIAAVPVNLASVLYNKTEGDLYVAAVNTLGVLYILEDGNTINSISDLSGTTLYATGQGSTPEYILRYVLEKNGIDPDNDLTIEYLSEHSELATLMTSGDVALGMLPEPNVTAALLGNSNLRISLDLTEEWKKVSDTDLVQGCIIINKSFADANPDLVKTFLEEYEASVDYVVNNVDEAATMCETAGIIPKAAVAKKAIPNCNLVMITGSEMKEMISAMLEVLYSANSSSVGGALPDESFYLVYE